MEVVKDIVKYAIAFFIGGIVGFIWCLQWESICRTADESGTELQMWKKDHFNLTVSNLKDELKAQGCADIDSAMTDAMNGSDSLRSSSCTLHGNIFGIKSDDGVYREYNHWTESVEDYLKLINLNGF